MSSSYQTPLVPPELLYDILAHVLCDHFHHYILDEVQPSWDVESTLFAVSHVFRDTTRKILSHAFNYEEGKNDDMTAFCKHRDILDNLHELALVSHDDSVKISENLRTAANAHDLPFGAAYMDYLAARKGIQRLTLDLQPLTLQMQAAVSVFQADVENARNFLRAGLQSSFSNVIPANFCEKVGRLLAEEDWFFSIFCLLRILCIFLNTYNEHDFCNATTAEPFAEMLRCTLQIRSNPNPRKKSLRAYGVTRTRVDKLTQDAFHASDLIPALRKLSSSPALNLSDPHGILETVRRLLEKWGVEEEGRYTAPDS